jgi:hypothetical protein
MSEVVLGQNNRPRSQRLNVLYDTLVLDESTQGFLDWVTGTVQVKHSFDEFDRIWHNGACPLNLFEAILHESFHAIQIALLGYLSRFAITMHTLIDNSFSAMQQHTDDYKQLLDKIPNQISQSTIYQNIMRDLHRKCDGVSVLDLVEGATYCAQNRARCDYDTLKYLRFLDEKK